MIAVNFDLSVVLITRCISVRYLKQFFNEPGLTVFEVGKKRPGDKRKRERNVDASDLEGFLGPWAKYKDEQTVMKPSEVR